MNLKLLQYIVAISEHKSISKAAEIMFISQSGLNQQLIRLERELGLQLFDRDKHHLQLTQAGKIYVENAKSILQLQKNTYRMLSDLKDNRTGDIEMGLTLEHGIDLFTSVFQEFNQHYPGINFRLQECHVAKQHELLSSGELDLGIVMLDNSDRISLEYITLYQEELVLGVPKQNLLASAFPSVSDRLPTAELSVFRNETFALMFPGSTMRTLIDAAFQKAGYSPKILIETGMNHALAKLVSTGLCCTILPLSRAMSSPYWPDIAWFHLNSPLIWDVAIVHRKSTYLSQAVRFFIQLAIRYGKAMETELSMK